MRVHHTGISVPDLDRSLAWYCAAFGFTPGFAFEVPQVSLRGAFAVGANGVSLELLERLGSVPGEDRSDPPAANAVHGFNHVCLAVADLDGAYRRAVAAGAREVWDPRPSPEPGVRMAYVSDPDGNLVELIEERAA
jgi:catechol 2,3-dioxygenase-like lactoylglutathione lyase family enzyme